MGIVKRIDRTELVLDGKVPAYQLKAIFDEICGDRLASLKVKFDPESKTTTALIYPCRIYTIINSSPSEKIPAAEERKIRIAGILPASYDIVHGCWMPIRKRAKRVSDELQWVVMYNPVRKSYDPVRTEIDASTGRTTTEIGFILDYRHDKEREADTLNRAADSIAECLRMLVSDINAPKLDCVRLVDEVSMAFRDRLKKLDYEETERRVLG